MGGPLVLGADCGGTATRVVVTTVDGAVVARASSGPANPIGDAPAALASLAAAVRSVLSSLDPARVVGGVVGMAGVAGLADDALAGLPGLPGLHCPLVPVGDAAVAFAAGTGAAAGTVLIAGTGAVAAEIRDGAEVRVADGLGWLLGDEGSGYWLGLGALRSTARALYRGDDPGILGRSAVARVGRADPDGFVTAVYALTPAEIAALAPLVVEAARAGDRVALGLTADAADLLVATLVCLHPVPGPIVLAGGLLLAVPELREAVQARLERRLGRRGVPAADTAEAAARLAARRFCAA